MNPSLLPLRTSALSAVQIFLILLLPSSGLASSLELYHSDYRKTSEYDPGSIRVFLKNTNDATVTIKHVLLDDIPIPVWGLTNDLGHTPPMPGASLTNAASQLRAYGQAKTQLAHKRIIWARLRPPVLPPGEVAEFVTKMAKPLARPSKISFITDAAVTAAVVRPRDRQLVISAITFSEDLGKAYCYIENRSTKTIEVAAAELDGRPADDQLWLSSPTIAPGGKQVAIIRPPKPFRRGAYYAFRIRSDAGLSAAERVRAFSFFPITAEMHFPGGLETFGLDAGRPIAAYQGAAMTDVELAVTNAPSPDSQCVYVFGCVMHAFRADQTRSAQQIFLHHDISAAVSPTVPSAVAPCKIRPEEGYGKFGETADILHFNPLVLTGSSSTSTNEPAHMTAARLGQLALAGAEPRRSSSVVAVNDIYHTTKLSSPNDIRKLVYTLVGNGVNGLVYRNRWWNDPAAASVNREIDRINREIRHVRPWLAVADTIKLIVPGLDEVSVYSLISPGHGVFLVLVNDRDEPIAQETIALGVPIPSWLEAKKLFQVSKSGLDAIQDLQGNEVADLKLPMPRAASMWLLECDVREDE